MCTVGGLRAISAFSCGRLLRATSSYSCGSLGCQPARGPVSPCIGRCRRYFGNAKGGLNHGGAGKGPWIMADMEQALWGADVVKSNEPPIVHDYVTAMIKGDVSVSGNGPGRYKAGVDYGGNDMAPCGTNGCELSAGATHADCFDRCNSTAGCVGYVFADSSCTGIKGALCWTKSRMSGAGEPRECRNSQTLVNYTAGHWAIKGGDAQEGTLHVYWDGKRAPG